ncbi:DUF421 domain-containing protein [Alteribacillus sp. JSM 102045]|uniref:DUF421 domain-containing protein n=1 Tax=Alteribacillus sp. JSM 102045 TaxID=1562101 RepID=UPI0035BEE9D0
MNTLTEIFIVAGRILTILPLLLFTAIFMGKRAIGELPVFDFLIVITLGSVVGADIADPNVHHLPTAAALVFIGIVQRLVASLKISNRTIGKYITFEPTVVVQDGKLLRKNLKKIRYSIDNILEALRNKDVFDINEVETAVVEASGSVSVLKKPLKNTVTLEDMNLKKDSSSIAFPVILEGKMYTEILQEFNVDEIWLRHQLKMQGVEDINKIFFASINKGMEIHVSLKEEPGESIPPIYN